MCVSLQRSGAVYEGTIQLENASVHVNPDVNAERKFTNLEVVLDEDVTSKEDVEKLGILCRRFSCGRTKISSDRKRIY